MGSVSIVGIGHKEGEALSPSARARLERAAKVVVASGDGSAAEVLEAASVSFDTFEDLGVSPSSPSSEIVRQLASAAGEGDVVLATAGYPLLKEGIISGLLMSAEGPVDVFPVASPLEVLVLAFDIDMTADLDIVGVEGLKSMEMQRGSHLVVTGVHNSICARRAADRLSDVFEPEHMAVVVGSLEGGGFELETTTVHGIPDLAGLGPDTVVYLPPARVEPPGSFAELVRTVATLRGPDGCPWDREQDHMSLRKNVIEEAYEVVEAIEAGDPYALAEELGDLLLQIALHAQIASEEGRFAIGDVTAGIVTKLRRRHPHIFGTVEVADADEVIANWEAIKREEKGDEGLLESVPESLPALLRAQKISRRVAHEGFDWESVEDVWVKVHEEIDELKAARAGTPDVVEEIGDVLFTMVNVARKLGVESETALRGACDKFARRYTAMEESAEAQGTSLAEMEISEMEALWEQAKKGPEGGPE